MITLHSSFNLIVLPKEQTPLLVNGLVTGRNHTLANKPIIRGAGRSFWHYIMSLRQTNWVNLLIFCQIMFSSIRNHIVILSLSVQLLSLSIQNCGLSLIKTNIHFQIGFFSCSGWSTTIEKWGLKVQQSYVLVVRPDLFPRYEINFTSNSFSNLIKHLLVHSRLWISWFHWQP